MTQVTTTDDKFVAVYQQLQRAAERLFAHERSDHTLQATAVVHEVFLKLRPSLDKLESHDYYALAAHHLRLYLVDYARQKRSQKRGGKVAHATFVSSLIQDDSKSSVDVEVLHEALEKLGAVHSRAAQVVTLKFFAGLEIHEIAATLASSEATIKRDWTFAKAWLHSFLTDQPNDAV